MKLVITPFLIIASFVLSAQRPDPDKFPTDKGDLIVQPIQHGTLVLAWNDQTIYVDPTGGATAFEGIDDPDVILITDIHGDHLSQETLDAIKTEGVQFVAPSAVADKLPETYNVTQLANNETTTIGDMKFEAMPMYNMPDPNDPRHPKGRGNGYILTLGSKRVYISGDTEDIPEMRALQNIDIAFVCMNLPYTMSVDKAASAVIEFQPDIVYPFHYRGPDGLSDVERFKKIVTGASDAVEVRLRNWYPGN